VQETRAGVSVHVRDGEPDVATGAVGRTATGGSFVVEVMSTPVATYRSQDSLAAAWEVMQVAALLQEYADLWSLTGGAAFKVRVHGKAARSVGGAVEVSTVDDRGLRRTPAAGRSIAAKIDEYRQTGRIAEPERLRDKVASGCGCCRRSRRWGRSGRWSPTRSCTWPRSPSWPRRFTPETAPAAGFGEKAEQLLHGIGVLQHAAGRVRLDVAVQLAERVVADPSGCPAAGAEATPARCRSGWGDRAARQAAPCRSTDVATGRRLVPRIEREACTGSACPGSRRRCGRTAVRSRPPKPVSCRGW
jgi:Helix-hairpin-helix domain